MSKAERERIIPPMEWEWMSSGYSNTDRLCLGTRYKISGVTIEDAADNDSDFNHAVFLLHQWLKPALENWFPKIPFPGVEFAGRWTNCVSVDMLHEEDEEKGIIQGIYIEVHVSAIKTGEAQDLPIMGMQMRFDKGLNIG
jgi:hypothetical protein